jgi:hypothetical protein
MNYKGSSSSKEGVGRVALQRGNRFFPKAAVGVKSPFLVHTFSRFLDPKPCCPFIRETDVLVEFWWYKYEP